VRENHFLTLLAQVTTPAADTATKEAPSIWPLLAAFAVIFYFVVYRPEKKKAQGQKTLLEGIKKNDRVQTIGGIVAVVTNVQREQDRVTLKIDETTGATIQVTLGSIARILAEEPTGSNS
jgi:preprotein translocase subunit YajC